MLAEDREKSRSDRITCRTLVAPGSKRLNKSVNPPKTASNEIMYAVLMFTSADILTLHLKAFFVLNLTLIFFTKEFLQQSAARCSIK